MQKIPVDAGFSCPNRDGHLSTQGCIYCSNSSFSPFYSSEKLDIAEQLRQGIAFYRKRYQCHGFLAYFQSFSCTYAPIEILRKKYNEALACPEISGLIISTRPDCLSDEVLLLLTELAHKALIRLELGIESFDDDVLTVINRCHNRDTAIAALNRVKEAGIPHSAHLIFGLPGEKNNYLPATADLINNSAVDMVKLHHLQIVKGSRLASIYQSDPACIQLHSLESYLDALCQFIPYLAPHIYIDRLINRSKPEQLLAPLFNIKGEADFQKRLEASLAGKGLAQGTLFSSKR